MSAAANPVRAPRPTAVWRNRSVLAFGLASLFSDAGHETATAVLPFFLVSVGGSAAALGLVEGTPTLYQRPQSSLPAGIATDFAIESRLA